MIDEIVERLEKPLHALAADADELTIDAGTLRAAVGLILSLNRDARRYCWLRDDTETCSNVSPQVWWCDEDGMPPKGLPADAMLHGSKLDEAVDAAIACRPLPATAA